MRIDFETPFEQLRNLVAQGRQLIYIPNPGNHGDALITIATVQAFEASGLPFTVFRQNQPHDAANVYIYGGGGNLVPMYGECKAVMKALSGFKADLIVLPQSCHGVAGEIRAYRGNLTIWARERASHAFLQSIHRAQVKYGLSEDLALGLDLSDQRFFYLTAARTLHSLAGAGQPGVLHAFRTDCEASGRTGHPQSDRNIDLSSLGVEMYRGFNLTQLDLNLLFNSAGWFLSYIDLFSAIHTDRLHVAIGALLLGKEVFLYDNSYGKVRAVYEHSLQNRREFNMTPMW